MGMGRIIDDNSVKVCMSKVGCFDLKFRTLFEKELLLNIHYLGNCLGRMVTRCIRRNGVMAQC